MANLNDFLGMAQVIFQPGSKIWGGFILLKPDPIKINQLDPGGSGAIGYYEGPVKSNGKYFMAEGKVLIKNLHVYSSELLVEFVGQGELRFLWCLARMPDDFAVVEKVDLARR